MKKVSILVPCYNEEEALPLFFNTLRRDVLDPLERKYEFEVIFVNDGSTDNTLLILQQMRLSDPRVNYIDLSRNFGKEIGMLAGMDFMSGDCLITLDADLQEPPSVIPLMLAEWEKGFDDVYGRRRDIHQSMWKKGTSKLYHRILTRLASVELPERAGDFRLLDRRCVEALRKMRETQRYTKGLYAWIGFNKAYVDYDVQPRAAGKTKWSFSDLFRLAVDGITSHSLLPLRFASYVGLIVSAIAFLFLLWVVIKALIWGDEVAGYPSLMAVILFLGGTVLLAIGIIGEYIGRIFMETKARPPYFVKSYNGEDTGS